jgi:hypothetical protein
VYDETLDAKNTGWNFWTRVVVIALFVAAAGAALLPSVTGFVSGDNDDRTCVAIVDAWHSGPAKPSAADMLAIDAAAPKLPSSESLNDPAVRARVRKQAVAFTQRSDVQQLGAYMAWQEGSGACVSESRHRLIITGALLGAVLVAAVAMATTVRVRRRVSN